MPVQLSVAMSDRSQSVAVAYKLIQQLNDITKQTAPVMKSTDRIAAATQT